MKSGLNWKLVDNWLAVLKYAWSIRFNLLSAISAGASAAIPYVTPGGTAFATLSAILGACAALFAGLSALSRVIHQHQVHAIDQIQPKKNRP